MANTPQDITILSQWFLRRNADIAAALADGSVGEEKLSFDPVTDAQLDDAVADLVAQLDVVNGRTATALAQADANAGGILALQSSVTALQSSVTTLQSSVTAVEAQLTFPYPRSLTGQSFAGGVNVGDVVYLTSTVDTWDQADAGAVSTTAGMLGVCTSLTGDVLLRGIYDGIVAGATYGTEYYVHDTAGAVTTTRHVGTKSRRLVGYAVSATALFVNPSIFNTKDL